MRKVVAEMVVICLLAVLPAVSAGFLHPQSPSWDPETLKDGEVRLETAMQWPQPLWVDARAQSDYDKQHVPGAVLLNEESWEEQLPGFLAHWLPGMNVVVYCSSSGCQASSAVAERLRQEVGLESVYVLKGGWEAWQNKAH